MTFQIPGSIISAADQAKASLNAAAAAAQPSYADMLNTIKSGSIFKDVSGQLGALGNLGVDTSAMAATIEKAKSTMSIDMAIANAGLAQKAKEAQAAGTTLSDADKEAAMGPLSVLKNLQSTMTNAMNSAVASISSAAGTLGTSLSGLNPTAALNSVASSATAFSASVPSQTIPDPDNPGQSIPNPAYTAFAADPANASKMSAVSSIASAASSIGSGLTTSLGGFAAAAVAAKAGIIGTLKADAMLATLTKPMPAQMGSIAGDSLNLGSINKFAAIKAQEAPAAIVPEKTPDAIRPASNANLLKGMPASAINNDNNKRIWTYELEKLNADLQSKRDAYFGAFGTTKDASPEAKSAAMNAWVASKLGPEKEEIRQQAVALKKAKPDMSTYTAEELAIVEQSKANGKALRETPEYIHVQTDLWGELDKYQGWYKIAYNNWIKTDNRFDLPAELLAKMGTYTL